MKFVDKHIRSLLMADGETYSPRKLTFLIHHLFQRRTVKTNLDIRLSYQPIFGFLSPINQNKDVKTMSVTRDEV